MTFNVRDVAAGAMFTAIGLFFTISTLVTLPIGQAFAMGPGYFPLCLGIVLVLLGLAICFNAIGKPAELIGRVSWRGVGLVMASIVFFGFTVRDLGFAPSLFISLMLSCFASDKLGWKAGLILSVLLTAFCVGVFIYALHLPYPVLGRWIVR